MMFWPRYCKKYEKFPVDRLQHDNEAFTPVNLGLGLEKGHDLELVTPVELHPRFRVKTTSN